MASTRRRGIDTSAMRGALIDATMSLLRDEGYAAITTRRVAEKVGLSRQIVHYYFHTVDDLLIAAVQRSGDQSLVRLQASLDSSDPLRVVWELNTSPIAASMAAEWNALAHRRPAIRDIVKHFAEAHRELQMKAVIRHHELNGIPLKASPLVATFLMTSISQAISVEQTIDISLGHAETLEYVKALVEGAMLDAEPDRPGK